MLPGLPVVLDGLFSETTFPFITVGISTSPLSVAPGYLRVIASICLRLLAMLPCLITSPWPLSTQKVHRRSPRSNPNRICLPLLTVALFIRLRVYPCVQRHIGSLCLLI